MRAACREFLPIRRIAAESSRPHRGGFECLTRYASLARLAERLPDLQKARGSNQASVKVGEAHPTYSPIESVDTFLKLCLATLALADRVLDHMGQNVSEMLRAVRVSEPHRPRRGGLNRGSASR